MYELAVFLNSDLTPEQVRIAQAEAVNSAANNFSLGSWAKEKVQAAKTLLQEAHDGLRTLDANIQQKLEQFVNSAVKSSLLGATAGVATSFGEMAAGTAQVVADSVVQFGDVLIGGINHDEPSIQNAWNRQKNIGSSLFNLVSNLTKSISNLFETIDNRYTNVMAQKTNYSRSFLLREFFNDVGQGAIGAGSGIFGAAKIGVSEEVPFSSIVSAGDCRYMKMLMEIFCKNMSDNRNKH